MTEQRKRFCDKYFETLNATKSAIYAGYSEETARIQASQLLNEDEVQEYLQSLRDNLAQRTGVTQERVLTEIARLSFSDIRKYYDENGFLKLPKELDDDAAAALAGIEIDEIWGFDKQGEKQKEGETKKVKLYDKVASLEKLMKHLGLYEKDNTQSKPKLTNIINLGSGKSPDETAPEAGERNLLPEG